jgi:soluble lytic murein transglycosylase
MPTITVRADMLKVVLSFVLLTLNLSPALQSDEERGLAELQSLTSSQSGDGQLLAVEKKYPDTRAAALARLLRGYRKYAGREYAAAVELLGDPLIAAKSRLGDQALFYAATSLLQAGRAADAERLFVRLWQSYPDSIHARESLMQAAESSRGRGDCRLALTTIQPLADASDAAALLIQAGCYERLDETKKAIELYERVYFDLPPTKESAVARIRLVALGVALDDLSRVSYERALGRADRLYRAGAFEEAARAYRAVMRQFPQTDGNDSVTLRFGISLAESGQRRDAVLILKRVSDRDAELKSEALYQQAECAKRLGQIGEFFAVSDQLVEKYPKTVWAARALYSRAYYELRTDQRREALELFRRLLALQPQFEFAPEASWLVGWDAYRSGDYRQAARILIEHVAAYPQSAYLAQAAYWAARAEEKLGERDRAAALYGKIVERYRYGHYGQLASVRLKTQDPRPKTEPSEAVLSRALSNLPRVQPPNETASEKAVRHVESAAELRLINLDELALDELQAASADSPSSPRVNLELARLYRDQDDHLGAINALRRAHPDYLAYQGGEAPNEVLQLLFPLTHWSLIREHAERSGLDPYLVAALIRQESGFNVVARSVANARGLMQLIPSTGRLVARRYGIRRISADQLYDPAINIRLGTAYLTDMIRQFSRIEYALGAYNAGPGRIVRWRRELGASEMDEWIESIPITQTRLYVQAVLRNAAHYRRIYGR